jgi:predicted O-methyltransferase YrrM
MTEELETYIASKIDKEPEELYNIYRRSQIHVIGGRMCSGHLQGRLLKMMVRMIRPKRILELGTFTGYSALCLAEGLPEGGRLDTIEIDDELEDMIRENFSSTPIGNRIHLHIGDAKEVLKEIQKESFDLVFIDANKREYVEYYDIVFPYVAKGGFIIADNTLWDGHVVDPNHQKDAQTQGIVRFNEYISNDQRVEKVIVPLRDGLTIIYKKDDIK